MLDGPFEFVSWWELRDRAVRIVAEVRGQHEADWAAMAAVAQLLGVAMTETLRKWVRRAEVDGGQRPGVSTDKAAEVKQLKRENADLQVLPHSFFGKRTSVRSSGGRERRHLSSSWPAVNAAA